MDSLQKTENQEVSQEQIILDAASKVFMRKGYEGARMQEIADEAGINKALLHYYFRSKELLFHHIFRQSFRSFWPSIEPVLYKADSDIRSVIKAMVYGYANLLEKMPYLPNFIINEINRDPAKVAGLIQDAGIKPEMVVSAFERAMNKGEIVRMDPRELIVNIIGLCVFPVITRPLLGTLLYHEKHAYEQFLQSRKETACEFICRAVCLNFAAKSDF